MLIFAEIYYKYTIENMKIYTYIDFLPLYLEFCDHSKCILADSITQWKNIL